MTPTRATIEINSSPGTEAYEKKVGFYEVNSRSRYILALTSGQIFSGSSLKDCWEQAANGRPVVTIFTMKGFWEVLK